ncbi:PEP-CTERM sorting domain-containing protein [Herbaspirillum robiniae]|uniref:PEP-CTERM sorting domain-containing protein n=1 Tax=Herbaspirillum robiniae TaxID=2014887 RepID=A0ABX2LUN2_9BURK|nr:PEP-CTERM sorting domain-containing protein [Herbaspirillum robiniae]NUU01821.1 PEP-CTERM sorting domain-containing protein [Herbaspirillum robiniae]
MKRLSLGIFSLFAVFLSATAAATPVTIGFDPLTVAGTGWTSIVHNVSATETSYTESGFVLSTTGNTPGQSGFGSAHTGQTDYYFGSTSLFNDDTNGGVTVLSKQGGGSFSLISMKIAAMTNTWSFYPGQEYVVFTGLLASGGTVSQSVLLLNNTSFQTVDFSGFTDVVSVSWAQGSAATKAFSQFDDIVVDASPAAPADVPEPASIALLGVGLLALTRKRGKSDTAA